jgi:hypothetical protein
MSTVHAIRKFMGTESGKALISIILGLGIASLFRKKPCSSLVDAKSKKDCIKFVSPDMNTLHEKVFQYGDECFVYNTRPTPCDQSKTLVDIHKSSGNPN